MMFTCAIFMAEKKTKKKMDNPLPNFKVIWLFEQCFRITSV